MLCRSATLDFLGGSSTELQRTSKKLNSAIRQSTTSVECNLEMAICIKWTKSGNWGKMHPSQETSRAALVREDPDPVEIRARGKEKEQGS